MPTVRTTKHRRLLRDHAPCRTRYDRPPEGQRASPMDKRQCTLNDRTSGRRISSKSASGDLGVFSGMGGVPLLAAIWGGIPPVRVHKTAFAESGCSSRTGGLGLRMDSVGLYVIASCMTGASSPARCLMLQTASKPVEILSPVMASTTAWPAMPASRDLAGAGQRPRTAICACMIALGVGKAAARNYLLRDRWGNGSCGIGSGGPSGGVLSLERRPSVLTPLTKLGGVRCLLEHSRQVAFQRKSTSAHVPWLGRAPRSARSAWLPASALGALAEGVRHERDGSQLLPLARPPNHATAE